MGILTIDINGVCNVDCAFCYQDLEGSILSKEQVFDIVDAYPSSTVEIGGGEPLLHKEITDIIKGIRKRGKKVHIATNATVIPKGFLELKERIRQGIQMQVSLHGSNSEVYQIVTGKNLFDNVIENAKQIQSKYSTTISAAIYQENYEDAQNIVELAYGLKFPIRLNLVIPAGKGENVQLLTEEQVDKLRNYSLVQRLQKENMFDSPLIHPNNCPILENSYGIPKTEVCPVEAGKKYFTPKGIVYGCEFLVGKPEGKLTQIAD